MLFQLWKGINFNVLKLTTEHAVYFSLRLIATESTGIRRNPSMCVPEFARMHRELFDCVVAGGTESNSSNRWHVCGCRDIVRDMRHQCALVGIKSSTLYTAVCRFELVHIFFLSARRIGYQVLQIRCLSFILPDYCCVQHMYIERTLISLSE